LGRAPATPAITIRPFAANDETDVLRLLGSTLGGGPAGQRPAEFFRWKHLDNPFGRSLMLVAEADDRIVGLRAFMRWKFRAADRAVIAVRAVDTATHPDYQGIGVFSRLTRTALSLLEGQADLVFNTPNGASRPGYLKLGWREVGRVPVAIRVRRPLRVARGVRGRVGHLPARPVVDAEPAARLLERADEIGRLLVDAGFEDPRLHTPRDLAYLRWRYGAAPLLDYRTVVHEEGGRLRGLAVFRIRPRGALWESTVSEVVVRSGDCRTARRLLRSIAGAAAVDHLTLHASASVGLPAGFAPAPGGIVFIVKPLRGGLRPDPTDLRAWTLSLGDLEVF
jgi:GNAT superfamily N-acetyltransferase